MILFLLEWTTATLPSERDHTISVHGTPDGVGGFLRADQLLGYEPLLRHSGTMSGSLGCGYLMRIWCVWAFWFPSGKLRSSDLWSLQIQEECLPVRCGWHFVAAASPKNGERVTEQAKVFLRIFPQKPADFPPPTSLIYLVLFTPYSVELSPRHKIMLRSERYLWVDYSCVSTTPE